MIASAMTNNHGLATGALAFGTNVSTHTALACSAHKPGALKTQAIVMFEDPERV